MTVQVSDTVQFNNKNYTLCGSEGGNLFHPKIFNLQPVVVDTACQRGYFCTYKIIDRELFLHGFGFGFNDGQRSKVKYGKGKQILGQKPTLLSFGDYVYYDNLFYEVDFTGNLLIAYNLLEEFSYSNMPNSVYHYNEVLEIILDKGKVLSVIDHSEKVKNFRAYKAKHSEEFDLQFEKSHLGINFFSVRYV